MLTATRARARRLLTAALTAALVLGSAQAVIAAPPWLPPVELAVPVENSAFGDPSVATADDGTTVIAFSRREGPINRVHAAIRTPGGDFQASVALSDTTVSANAPTAAIDPQGNITVAWLAGGVVQAAYRPAGQGWGPAQPLSASDGQAPSIAAGTNGGAVVGWYSGGTVANQVARVAVRDPGSPFFASAVTVSSTTSPYPNGGFGVFQPQVAMDAAGGVIAVWARQITYADMTTRTVIESAIRPAGSPTFDPATGRSRYDAGGASSDPNVVMTPAGKATAVWAWNDGTSTRLEYADRAPGGTFGSRNTLTDPAPVSVGAADVAGNDGGAVAVSWAQAGSVYASVRPNGGAFTAPQAVAGPPANASSAAVAISDNGDALVVWPSLSTGDYSVFSSRRRGDGSFGEVTEVVHGKGTAPTTGYYSPAVGIDDQGNAFLAVRREISDEPKSSATVGIGYDVVAPVLASVSAPSAVTLGKVAAFKATATDRMGSPAISWDFGDGGTATAGVVSHTFRKVGAFTIKVAAVDAAGNRVETTRQVVVKAVPRIAATSALKTTRLRAGKTRVKSLRVSHLRTGDRVTLVCKTKARGCKKTTIRTTKATGSSISLTKYVKGLTLKPKATLVLKITRTGAKSRTIVYTTRAKKAPTKKVR